MRTITINQNEFHTANTVLIPSETPIGLMEVCTFQMEVRDMKLQLIPDTNNHWINVGTGEVVKLIYGDLKKETDQ